MSYRKFERPIKLFKAGIYEYDGEKCTKPFIKVREFEATHHSTAYRKFRIQEDGEQIYRYIPEASIAHMADGSSCPTRPSGMYWKTKAKALSALRSDELKDRRNRVKSAKDYFERRGRELKEAETGLKDSIDLFRAFKATQ